MLLIAAMLQLSFMAMQIKLIVVVVVFVDKPVALNLNYKY